MVNYGYECDTCELNHLASFDTLASATWFLTAWKDSGLKTWALSNAE